MAFDPVVRKATDHYRDRTRTYSICYWLFMGSVHQISHLLLAFHEVSTPNIRENGKLFQLKLLLVLLLLILLLY